MSQTSHAPSPHVIVPPHPELRRLDPLVGRWSVDGHVQESLAGPAASVTSRETFEWLDGGYFLVHRYETTFGDQSPQTGVMFWGYDGTRGRFLLHFFSNNGPFTVEGNIYEGEVNDRSLVCTGPARFRIPLDDEGKISVSADGTFDTEWELRDAEGIWRSWMRDTYRMMK